MIFALRFALCVVATTLAFGGLHAEESYKGAIVIDAATGKVLLEENADIVTPPASITKLMTFLVVHDHIASGAISLQTPVPVGAASAKIGGTQVWLKQGESFSVEEMLYALMIQSANDCAHALALVVAGSSDAFVELMNQRAASLGMTRTTFRSPHGLPPANRKNVDGDLTTPRDLAILSRYLVQHTDILTYTSVKERAFRAGSPTARIDMRNHNHLLGNVEGADGLKTGYTRGAGFCLAATAQRNGRRIIAVIMGSPASKTRDLKMMELIKRGFTLLPPADSPLSLAPLPVEQKSSAPSPVQPVDDAPVIKFSIPKR